MIELAKKIRATKSSNDKTDPPLTYENAIELIKVAQREDVTKAYRSFIALPSTQTLDRELTTALESLFIQKS